MGGHKLINIDKDLSGIKKEVSLREYTSFKVGGKAKYFFIAKSKEALIKAMILAKKNKIPFYIIGWASNLLVSDSGFNGLVIKNESSEIILKDKKQVIVDSGVALSKLINFPGLGFLAGIPGTLGGAIYGNAGAFGRSIGEFLKNIEVLDLNKLKIIKCQAKDCYFSYRKSCFKNNKNLIILSATIYFQKKEEIKIKDYFKYKRDTQPLNFPSAGSVFKNYQGVIKNNNLIKKYSELKKFNKEKIIPAAWLIEICGLKGKRIGNAEISKKHANFIINLGKSKSKDIFKLINLIKNTVKIKFKIDLKEEIQYLGDF